MGAFNIWKLLIVLLIVVLIFGTKRLKSIASDLGGALKGFKGAMDAGGEDEDDVKPPKRISGEKPDAEFSEQKDKSGQAK